LKIEREALNGSLSATVRKEILAVLDTVLHTNLEWFCMELSLLPVSALDELEKVEFHCRHKEECRQRARCLDSG
jgi:hypothetical protein